MSIKKKLIKGRVIIILKEGNTKTLDLYYKSLYELAVFKKLIERCPNVREVRY